MPIAVLLTLAFAVAVPGIAEARESNGMCEARESNGMWWDRPHGYHTIKGQKFEEREVDDGFGGWDTIEVEVSRPAWMSGEWQSFGTCRWRIADNVLTIEPANGSSGTLGSSFPWIHLGNASERHFGGRAEVIGDCTIVDKVIVKPGVKATTCKGMFKDFCETTSFDLSGLDTSQAKSMASMFSGCMAVESLDLSGLNTSGITDMSYMFSSCLKLKHIDLSRLDLSRVTSMRGAFGGFPARIDGDDTSHGIGCFSLQRVSFPKSGAKNVRDMSDMFVGSGSGMLQLVDFDTSGVTNMKGMFKLCTASGLNLSTFNTSNVTDMSYMFHQARNLKELDLSMFNTSKVKDMSFMFGCESDWYYLNMESLASLNLSSFDTRNVTNMNSMFRGCKVLPALDLSSFNTSGVRDMEFMFCDCPKLKSIKASSGFTTTSLANGANMFRDCTSLVGGSGTKYSAAHTSQTYARIDAPGAPGYLTGASSASAVVPAKLSLAGATVTVKGRTWTGKTLKPASVSVKLRGKTLRKGTDYSLSCKGGKAVGTYKVTVTGKGSYTGTKRSEFKIVPKAVSSAKAKGLKKSLKVTWKAPSKAARAQVTGYQVRCSVSKSMRNSVTVKVKGAAKTSVTVTRAKDGKKLKRLKAGKKYYVQVRAYKTVKGKIYYSAWSAVRSAKAKK